MNAVEHLLTEKLRVIQERAGIANKKRPFVEGRSRKDSFQLVTYFHYKRILNKTQGGIYE